MNTFAKKLILNTVKNNRIEKRSDTTCETYMVINRNGKTLAVINNDWYAGEYTVSLGGRILGTANQNDTNTDNLRDIFEIISTTRKYCR